MKGKVVLDQNIMDQRVNRRIAIIFVCDPRGWGLMA